MVLAYPYFEKPFDLYTDASDLQLGATLVQEGKPIVFTQEENLTLQTQKELWSFTWKKRRSNKVE